MRERWLAEYEMPRLSTETVSDSPNESLGAARKIRQLIAAANRRCEVDQQSFIPLCDRLIGLLNRSSDSLLPEAQVHQKQPIWKRRKNSWNACFECGQDVEIIGLFCPIDCLCFHQSCVQAPEQQQYLICNGHLTAMPSSE